MNLGIVILNWNGRQLLEEYLPSVVEHSTPHRIYVADNASKDNSLEWLRSNYPAVKIIEIPQNLGYAGGYNYAMEHCEEDIVCLLNNDVAVTSNWCEPVLEAFARNRSMTACQPKILSDRDKSMFEYAGASGGFLDKLGYPYCRGRIFDTVEKDQGQYDDELSIDWATGAALFIRRELFINLQGFDESFFAHQEEIDLCWRLRNQGHDIKVIPSSIVYHLGAATLAASSPRKTYLNFRNSLTTIVKNDYGNYVWLRLFLRMILDGIAGLRFLIAAQPAQLAAVLKAHFHFYNRLGASLKKREHLKALYLKPSRSREVTSIVYQYYIKGNKKFEQL
ncbi:glycosyltransferase family 2 protein [Nonlabens ponticola]|uniref:Glycosyltransferase family 2 protein n=1 Tax=Nonlabens ponticola TaxID=2496866 RepID=A0A3S9MZV0_9FLAO|nr:glycosyltransferase family 2 protein [Nonlabens ponticola]AZQ44664.1 glycosyltransferase family 2 protein [Nonlabens ponticola]